MSKAALLKRIGPGERLLIDTSVLMAYLDAADATHPVARFILNDLVAGGRNPAVISMITVMELLVRPLQASPPGHHTVLAFLRTHPNLEPIPVDLQVAQEAAKLRADKKFKPADALVVGTGLAAQVRYLATNDHNWATKLSTMAARIAVVQVSDYLPFP